MTLEKSQIVTHIQKSLTFTAYDVKWVPHSARFVVLGQHSRGTGALHVYELDGQDVKLLSETEKEHAIKCGTFAASSLHDRHLATGDFEGRLSVWDLERTQTPVYTVRAHDQIINCIDGCGGVGVQTGPPEIVTGSRDGTVKIWDVRVKDKPVAKIGPAKGEAARDTWAVSFGNSYNDEERWIAAGYENGDVKLFDLRAMALRWETNLKNGICAIEFDRKDIRANKMVVTTLESSFHVFDLRTQHPKNGFASTVEKAHDNTTVWTVKHLPQNRDIFMTSGGNGTLNLYKYNYPSPRTRKDADNKHDEGVPGTVELINNAKVAEQPVAAFDWNPDKQGLCAFASFDQSVRVGIVTRLGQY
ncbi:WD repeat-containing protein 92 [Rhizophlyctis rosea]|uniref:WD repeat-containing protein 92 n=1 Tax=Rhizophlyctis rosea TaxID=64517 RepID=A0AAD5S9D5_9FUNG|nr:WD repeat-containing protein 92 [Rhizophlyctis rosea]